MLTIQELAIRYNHIDYFKNDPIIFPRHFMQLWIKGEATLKDIEISGILCAHLAWGRREMIARNCKRLLDEMSWKPYAYIMSGIYRNGSESLHRTIKWSEMALIFNNLKEYYISNDSLEPLTPEDYRVKIFGRRPDPNAANKKIHMFRRWMIRNDGKVDLGIWKNSSAKSLIIPLDTHVHQASLELGITKRESVNIKTALEITNSLAQVFPDDPCLGDFALFGYSLYGKK